MSASPPVLARLLVAGLLLLAGCGDDGASPAADTYDVGEPDAVDTVEPLDTAEADADTAVAEDTVEEVDTAEALDTAQPVDTVAPVDTAEPDTVVISYDCDDLPQGPFPLVLLDGPIASEDLAFDDQGHVVGGNDTAIFKSGREGPPQLFVPSFEFRAGLRYLPNGHLMVCDNTRGELVRVDPDGVRHPVMTGLSYPNGLAVDLHGWVYFSEHEADIVWRVHPFTGEASVVTAAVEKPNGLAFDSAYETLYISSFDDTPTLWAVKIAPDGTPGRVFPFVEGLGSGWHDGLGVDACGNVYVADFNEARIYRVSYDGAGFTMIIDAIEQPNPYLPNLQWGSGLGGFSETAIYIPDGWNKGVFEVEIGVPGIRRPYPP